MIGLSTQRSCVLGKTSRNSSKPVLPTQQKASLASRRPVRLQPANAFELDFTDADTQLGIAGSCLQGLGWMACKRSSCAPFLHPLSFRSSQAWCWVWWPAWVPPSGTSAGRSVTRRGWRSCGQWTEPTTAPRANTWLRWVIYVHAAWANLPWGFCGHCFGRGEGFPSNHINPFLEFLAHHTTHRRRLLLSGNPNGLTEGEGCVCGEV